MRRGDGAALLGFGSVGFEIRLLRVSGLTVRKIAFQMLIFTAVGLQIRPSGVKEGGRPIAVAFRVPPSLGSLPHRGSVPL